MNQAKVPDPQGQIPPTLMQRLQQRGVLRVAFSYAVIAWLTLQIGDVVLEPLDAPAWMMRALIVVVAVGFPVTIVLAWFFELGPSGITRDTLPEAAPRPTVRGVRRYSDVLIIGVLLVAVIFLLLRQQGWIDKDGGPRVVGILPFTVLGSTETAYLGTGLADTLSYKLGQMPQLTVLAPSSTFQFHGQGLDLKSIGAKLGASALLEGTVLSTAGSLRVNARLVDVQSGQQLWSGSLDRSATDLFAMQDEIAQSVADALHLALNPQEIQRLSKPQTDSLSAYDAYLKGRVDLALRNTESLWSAVDHFREATRLDPGFALAWGSLAEAIFLSVSYGLDTANWPELAREARAAAGMAQTLDPDSGEPWLAQAFVAMGDNNFGDGTAWPKTHIATLLSKAVELSPNNAVALKALSNQLEPPEEKLALLQRAALIDPRSAIIRLNMGDLSVTQGDFEAALRYFREALNIMPSFGLAYMAIGNVYKIRGELDQSARWARAMFEALPADYRSYFDYSSALAQLGAWDEFVRLMDRGSRIPEAADPDWWRQVHSRAQIFYEFATTRDCGRIMESIIQGRITSEDTGTPIPDVTKIIGGEPSLVAWALCEWVEGRPQVGVQLLESGIPNLSVPRTNNMMTFEARTNIIYGALLKATGQHEEAQLALSQFLEQTAEMEVASFDGVGFGRFFALAVQGETNAALDELEYVLGLGYTNDWWMLGLLSPDPEFARLMENPRFLAIMSGLEGRIQKMRESYQANPELPGGFK